MHQSNNTTNSNDLHPVIKRTVETSLHSIKGFQLGKYYLAIDNTHVIAVDRSKHKIAILVMRAGQFNTHLFDYSDLRAAYLLKGQTVISSRSHKNHPETKFLKTVFSSQQDNQTKLRIETVQTNQYFEILFKTEQSKTVYQRAVPVNKEAEHWFEICRSLINRAENKTDQMAYRSHLFR